MTETMAQFNKEKMIFWVLTVVFFVCLCLNFFFMKAYIKNVVTRENLEEQVSKIALNISSQESKYIKIHSAVTLPVAYSLGFKDVTDKTYISRKTGDLVSYLPR